MEELNNRLQGNQSTPSDKPSTSGNNQNTATVWDQEFYDTLTPEQQKQYKNYDDKGREMMKSNMEVAREWEKNGYRPAGDGDLTGEDIVNSWSHITTP